MVEVEYRCADGTPFPVSFPDEAAAQRVWLAEREHQPRPETALGCALAELADPGRDRAYGEWGLPVPPFFEARLQANGFMYFPEPGGDMAATTAALFEGCSRLVERFGSAAGIWATHLPVVRDTCAAVRDAPLDRPLAELAELHGYGQNLTMISAFVAGNDQRLLAEVVEPLYPGAGALVANELAAGNDNTTLAADQALWDLARQVAASPALTAALGAADPAAAVDELRARGEEAGFVADLDAFLATYGDRAETWLVGAPTWGERGPGLWAQLRQLAREGTPSPADAQRRSAARRQAVVDDIEARVDDADLLARIRRRVERVQRYVAVREERAMWQLIDYGSLRLACLARGDALVARGVLRDRTDVLHLLPGEVEDPPADAQARADARRAEHEAWSAKVPPLRVGGGDAPPPVAPDGVVQGVGVSRGTATGTARVVTDLADIERVEPGDVLVCVMTAPPWTPAFGIAAAVVTDSGDMGSHPSIAAREYGIPCVVGTKVGTLTIPDGARVTVDGVAGTVTVG